MKFEPSQSQRIVLDCKDKNILVSASAGTGKTTVMIEKISGIITEKRATLKELLVVTFTEMAAYEMKKRLVKNLSQSDDKQVLDQLGQIDTCNISTLHSFCSQLIRKYFVEADIDPAYKILSDTEWVVAFDNVLEQTFEKLYQEHDADFLHLVDIFGSKRKDDNLKKVLKQIYSFKVSKHNFDGWLKNGLEQYQIKDDQNFFVVQYNNQLCSLFEKIKARCENLAIQANQMGMTDLVDYFAKLAGDIYISRHKTLQQNVAELLALKLSPFQAKKYEKQAENDMQLAFANYCKVQKEDISTLCKKQAEFFKDQDYQTMLDNMTTSGQLCQKVFELVQKFQDEFGEYKKQNGCLDFNDLEHKAIKVLSAEKVRQEVVKNFKYVFVDEYQDINEIQEEIISLIRQENNLFLVGDVKQSIYAFRQCAPDIFVDKLNTYSQDDTKLVAYLNDNYRSHGDVLDFVNHLFANLMTDEFGGINYRATSMLGIPKISGAGKTELCAVNVDVVLKEKKEKATVDGVYSVHKTNTVDDDAQKAEAKVIFDRIRQLVGNKMVVDGVERVITYNDIVLLTRGMNNQTKKIITQLQAFGLPVMYTSRQNLFGSVEMKYLINLFKVIDNRYDDVAMFGCLTGCFCGATDDEVAHIVEVTNQKQKKAKTLAERVADYCQAYDNTLSHRLQAFLQFLDKFAFLSKHLSVTQLVARIFANTNYTLHVLGLPDGEVRLKKINDFLASLGDKACNKNVGEFLQYVGALSDEKTEVDSDARIDAIKVMTIHKSKGLEFPVVFVINCGQKFNLDTDTVVCNKKHGFACNAFDVKNRSKSETLSNKVITECARLAMVEEEMRILYVAMTRAKSHLFLTGCVQKDKKKTDNQNGQNYFDWILGVLDEHPFFKDRDQYNVYSTIHNQADEQKTRQDVLFKPCDEKQKQVIAGQLAEKYHHQFATTLDLKAVSSKLHDYQKPQGDEEVVFAKVVAKEVDADGLQQNEIGTGYHSLFEHLDFGDKSEANVQKTLDSLVEQGRISEQVAGVIDKNLVLKALESPVFDNIQSKQVYRELPFMLKTSYNNLFGGDVDENVFLQGVIDMLIIDKDVATVVDYKYTSRPQYIKQNYQKQLDSYAQAVKQILKIDKVKKYVLSLYDGALIEL